MSIKIIIGLVAYSVFCFLASIVFARCSEKQAQERIQDAVIRAETAEATVYTLETENTKLRDLTARANTAIEKTLTLIIDAQDKHNERMEIIETDPATADWRECRLPDGVREAFTDYYGNRANNTP